jgi:hypothetical protein
MRESALEVDCSACSCGNCSTFWFSSNTFPANVRTPACSAVTHWLIASTKPSCALA